MKLLALPGKSQSNYQWFSLLINTINLEYSELLIQQYNCWLSPDEEINLEAESEKAIAAQPDLIIAKSLGVIVASRAFAEYSQNKKFVFIGTPVQLYRPEWLVELKKISIEADVLFIQQRFDKTGTTEELRSIVSDKCTISEVSGSDHLYSNQQSVSNAIELWYKRA